MEKTAARTGASSYRSFRPYRLYAGYVSVLALTFVQLPNDPHESPITYVTVDMLPFLSHFFPSLSDSFQPSESNCTKCWEPFTDYTVPPPSGNDHVDLSHPNVGLRRKQCWSVYVSKKYYFIMKSSSFTRKPHNCGGFLIACLFLQKLYTVPPNSTIRSLQKLKVSCNPFVLHFLCLSSSIFIAP